MSFGPDDYPLLWTDEQRAYHDGLHDAQHLGCDWCAADLDRFHAEHGCDYEDTA